MGVRTFPKVINTKVNVMAQREFELAYYDIIVKQVSHCTMKKPPSSKFWFSRLTL